MKTKSSLNEDFKKIGKHISPKPDIHEQSIYFDDRQHSLKLPKKLMDKIGYKEGDKIRFILNKPFKSFDDLKIEYVREDGK